MDGINIIGTPEELPKAMNCLKKEFEMKDLGKTKLCLGLQIEHLDKEIFVHQEGYIEKVLKHLYMDKCHPLSTPMVVRSLDVEKVPFRPRENDEELLGPKVPYLSAIGALIYLANYTRPDISFVVNLLVRYNFSPTLRYLNGVKHILCYLRGTIDISLFLTKVSRYELTDYADASYLSDPHNGKSQIGYLFRCGNTVISWR
ncbi:secreted RxLR effector protein 161-like [Lathyrus oleraceus]|uniref:secreted RxLR effector protein 161-like n=1 Tax=Pisum sativum TaxID=3888 RepID=UPI0021D04D37|nr:secreted RxLR effector protein 161-like [Pisum sativum]